ncbi:MAG: hypothetical protein KBT27_05080 [Prevotellaceae bacterium]|nr:hypothetical protein [Candidatus Faecinaster equi]
MSDLIPQQVSLQERIKAQAEKSQNDTLWGKPANDILNGRNTTSGFRPIRAIWEMVQNARDVSAGSCRIVFTRKEQEFEFKHDGLPFTNHTLDSLILQTSSKVRMDIEQVGQYGTGFLTTHCLGREFDLIGSLKLLDDEELYCNFPVLTIDRTPDTREEMVESLSKQFKQKENLGQNTSLHSTKPSEWTIFRYKQPNAVERQNSAACFELAPNLIPYVMCLNASIKSITFADKIENKSLIFERGNSVLVNSTELSAVYETEIICRKPESCDVKKIMTLSSNEKYTTQKGKTLSKVEVILPIDGNNVYDLGKDISKLFLVLPLVGTEQWGVNFIINSPLFTCQSDDRSSLRLVEDGQSNSKAVDTNRQSIALAEEMIFDYLKNNVQSLSSVRFLATIGFEIPDTAENLGEYYHDLKRSWIEKMKGLPLVDVTEKDKIKRVSVETIIALDKTLLEDAKDNGELLESLYNIMAAMKPDCIPIKEHLIYWSTILDEWYGGKTEQVVGIKCFVDYIHSQGLYDEKNDRIFIMESDLFNICRYLKESKQLGFFEQNILLTDEGGLTNCKEGLKPIGLNELLINCLKVLSPEKTSKFVKSEYCEFIGLTEYNIQDARDSIALYTERKIKEVTDLAGSFRKAITKDNFPSIFLSEAERRALVNLCCLLIPKTSVAFEANSLKLICEYYGLTWEIECIDEAKCLQWRGPLRLLLNNVLYEYSLLAESDKANKRNWIINIIAEIFPYSDFKAILKQYKIYNSQTGNSCYCDELKKDRGIPEGMKDIYNVLFSTNDSSVEIRSELFDAEFGKYADTEAEMNPVVVGNTEITKKILDSGKYPGEIDTYEHKDKIMDIINMFDDICDGQVWKCSFERISSDTPMLLTKLVLNNDSRDSMIRIMKVKEKQRLEAVAEIINNEHMFEILDKGKNALLIEQNNNADFEKKKELGKYVEGYLRKEIGEALNEYDFKIEPEPIDEQGGQDIIVFLNEKPIYYIEVKSRWIVADSVMMSACQLNKSVIEKDRYSLFAVNMLGFKSEDVKEHIYPASMDEFADRIKVITNIGYLNDEIIPPMRNVDEEVHLGGDYKAVVPQNLITREGMSYQSFVDDVLKQKVLEEIKKM